MPHIMSPIVSPCYQPKLLSSSSISSSSSSIAITQGTLLFIRTLHIIIINIIITIIIIIIIISSTTILSLLSFEVERDPGIVNKYYTQSALEDSGIFGPNPSKILESLIAPA